MKPFRSLHIMINIRKHLTCLLIISSFTTSISAQPWMVQNVGFQSYKSTPCQISIVDVNTVWTIASRGYFQIATKDFSRTTDGGANWQSGTIPVPSGYILYTIGGIDANRAFVGAVSLSNGIPLIYKTDDGGANWYVVDSGLILNTPGTWIEKIHFRNAQEGIMITDGWNEFLQIFTTSDGGNNWVPVPSSDLSQLHPGEYTENLFIDIKGNNIWFGTSEGRMCKSSDYGQTWTVHSLGTVGYSAVSFLSDGLHGFAMINNLNDIVVVTSCLKTIEPNSLTQAIQLYPNPAHDELNILFHACCQTRYELRIFDALGKLLFSQTKEAVEGGNQTNVSVDHLLSGVYQLIISGKELNHTARFIVE